MILVFHSAYYIFKFLLRTYRRFQFLKRKLRLQTSNSSDFSIERDAEENLTFDPPVYRQRYCAVQDILLDYRWRKDIRKVVDFGCAEFGMFIYLKRLVNIEKISFVDIAEDLLRDNLFKVRPLTVDYLNRRPDPLTIDVFVGSVSTPDVRLLHTDVVIAIELIEHLYPDTLDALPYNIFGFIQPKLAIFTTPNADFNVLFPNFKRFRHYDHKFEWTREQFESWAINITHRFPKYTVYFEGIGLGPEGTEHFGSCSQMAVFVWSRYAYSFSKKPRAPESDLSLAKSSSEEGYGLLNPENYTRESYQCYESFGVCTYHSYSKHTQDYEASSLKCDISDISNYQNSPYKFIESIECPYSVDERSTEDVILQELQYSIHLLGRVYGRYYNEDCERSEIPLADLVYNQQGYVISISEASAVLQKAGYKIEGCVNPSTKELELCVIYEPEMETHSSSSFTETSDFIGESEWESIGEAEAHDWDTTDDHSTIQFSEHRVKKMSKRSEALSNAGNLLHEIIDKVQEPPLTNVQRSSSYTSSDWNTEETSTSKENSQGKDETQCDSGFLNSHSYLSGDVSGSIADEIEENIDLGVTSIQSYLKVEVKSPTLRLEKKKALVIKTNECIELKDEENVNRNEQVKEIEPCKKTYSAKEVVKDVTDEHFLKKGKLSDLNKKGPPKEAEDAGGSNIKRRKKQRRNGHDENPVKEQPNPKDDDDVEKNGERMQVDAVNGENGLINELLLEQVAQPVVENGDLVNNNRDYEGNNYPDAPNAVQNVEEMANADNENQNRVIENGEENHLNEDIQNRNDNNEHPEQLNPHEAAAGGPQNREVPDDPAEELLEVEHASREALFDPNSQIDLLEGFFNLAPAEVNMEANPQQPRQDGIVVIGLNRIDEDNPGAVLPPHANPFPNWLLHLLENEEIGNITLHDEPHFYCQGDGIGVHPSIIEVDLEDDSSETESEDSTRSAAEDNSTLHTNSNSQSDMLSFMQDTDSQNHSLLNPLSKENSVVIKESANKERLVSGESRDEQASGSGARAHEDNGEIKNNPIPTKKDSLIKSNQDDSDGKLEIEPRPNETNINNLQRVEPAFLQSLSFLSNLILVNAEQTLDAIEDPPPVTSSSDRTNPEIHDSVSAEVEGERASVKEKDVSDPT